MYDNRRPAPTHIMFSKHSCDKKQSAITTDDPIFCDFGPNEIKDIRYLGMPINSPTPSWERG